MLDKIDYVNYNTSFNRHAVEGRNHFKEVKKYCSIMWNIVPLWKRTIT